VARGFTRFSTGGKRTFWQSQVLPTDRAVVVAESAIDALSYHALHPCEGLAQRHLSSAGAPSGHQLTILNRIFSGLPTGCTVIADVDSDAADDQFSERYATLAGLHAHLRFGRDSPREGKDWSDLGKSAVGTRLAPNPRDPLYFETAMTLPVDFHSFRRAFNTALAEADISVQKAMTLAAHSDAKTHMRYDGNEPHADHPGGGAADAARGVAGGPCSPAPGVDRSGLGGPGNRHWR
jgi:hypothetical protein